MGVADLGDRPSATCAGCHNDSFVQFGFTERGHRIEEGVMECTSCHNPHEKSARVALGGFKQQQCAECHADKNGPWVFEHPAGRVEGCVFLPRAAWLAQPSHADLPERRRSVL